MDKEEKEGGIKKTNADLSRCKKREKIPDMLYVTKDAGYSRRG